MILSDLPPKVWLSPKPAVVRAASSDDLVRIRAAGQATRKLSMVPGLMPVFLPVASALSISLALSHRTGTGGTHTLPAGILAGDCIVFVENSQTSSGMASDTVPSGFTQRAVVSTTLSGYGMKTIISTKIAAGTESGANLAGMTANPDRISMVFRGNKAIASISHSTPVGQGSTGDPSAQTIAASGGVAPLVCIAAAMSYDSAARNLTISPAEDGEIPASGSAVLAVAYKIYNSAPADVTADINDTGVGQMLLSLYLQFA